MAIPLVNSGSGFSKSNVVFGTSRNRALMWICCPLAIAAKTTVGKTDKTKNRQKDFISEIAVVIALKHIGGNPFPNFVNYFSFASAALMASKFGKSIFSPAELYAAVVLVG